MKDEALKLALEALKELVAQTEARLFAVKHDHVALQNARKTITAIKQALAAQPAVPDALNPKDENPAYAAGWNDCRAEMLRGMK
jgi:hypothetical protein